MDITMYTELMVRADALVKEHLTGHRKGMPDMPNYAHSVRVAKLLKHYGFDESVQLAGLLHDIVEDGDVSFEMLGNEGFPEEIIDTIRLCTHDVSIQHRDHRWILMVVQLAKADSAEAWAVKLADVLDNLMDAHMLSKERGMFMREVKVPVLLSASKQLLGETPLWQDLKHVSCTITQMVGEIGGIILYIKHILETQFDSSGTAEVIVTACCNKIDELNCGVASTAQYQAIKQFQDIAIAVLRNSECSNPTLEALANGWYRDILFHWEIGNEIKNRYLEIVANN